MCSKCIDEPHLDGYRQAMQLPHGQGTLLNMNAMNARPRLAAYEFGGEDTSHRGTGHLVHVSY